MARSSSGVATSVSELLYPCYFTLLTYFTIVYANTPSPTYRHPDDTDHPHTVTPVVSVEYPLQWTLARSRGYRRRRCRCRLLSITCPSPFETCCMRQQQVPSERSLRGLFDRTVSRSSTHRSVSIIYSVPSPHVPGHLGRIFNNNTNQERGRYLQTKLSPCQCMID